MDAERGSRHDVAHSQLIEHLDFAFAEHLDDVFGGDDADDAAGLPDLKASTTPGYYRQHALAGNDLPKGGRPGQAKPKNGKCERFEVAIYGYCWVKLDGKAPCGPTAYDYDGGCYRPVFDTPTTRRGEPPRPGPLTAAE